MSEHMLDPDEVKGLTEEEQAALDEEMAEFRKLLSQYAQFVADHPEIIESLRENLAFSAKLRCQQSR